MGSGRKREYNMNPNPMEGNSGSAPQGNSRGSVDHTSGVFAIRVSGSQGVSALGPVSW